MISLEGSDWKCGSHNGERSLIIAAKFWILLTSNQIGFDFGIISSM